MSPREHPCNLHSEHMYSHLCHNMEQNYGISICVKQLLYKHSRLQLCNAKLHFRNRTIKVRILEKQTP
jgi:hypothetical protein